MAPDFGKDAACCRKGDSWDGEPSGKETKIGGLDAYVAEPPQPTKKAVLLIPDIHGWDAKNSRLFADGVAQAGFLTVLPDFFHGDKFPDPPTPELWGKWVERNPFKLDGRTNKDAKAVLAELREKHGITAVGGQGFCWGGFHLVHLASQGEVDTAVIAHGSKIEADMLGRIGTSSLWVVPEKDAYMTEEFQETIKKELENKPMDFRMDIYPGMEHGFTLRPKMMGEKLHDEGLLKASQQALDKSIEWFKEHLKA